MSTAVKRPPNLRCDRYPPGVKAWARRAYAEGHTVKQIKAALGVKGLKPSWSTVIRWVDPDYNEAENTARATRPRTRAWWARRRRMYELRGLRVSYRSIADILNNDFGLELTEYDARFILQDRYAPEKIRRLLGASG